MSAVSTPNQPTPYGYDTLDNLTTVTQVGVDASNNPVTQTRSFVYDSRKRLTSATNPESGATTYTYDNNSNLINKVDALNRTTWYYYDALNRPTITRSNNADTPEITNRYDTLPNGKGHLSYNFTTSYWVGSTSWKYLTYSPLTAYDELGRPTAQTQYYCDAANTTWSAAYTTSRTYDLTSNMKSQTSPSGRIVNYKYNTAGQMTTFTGNLGDGTTRNYATAMTYTAAGQMTQENFGVNVSANVPNGIWHNTHYNNRLQMTDTRIGTGINDGQGQEWTWNRGAIRLFYAGNNNGNIARMDHYAPTNESTAYAMSVDYYGYDHLNHMTGIAENKQTDTMGETGTGLAQYFMYDRYGNRTVNNAASNFPGVYNLPFTVTTASNRLQTSGNCMVYDAVGNLINDCNKTRTYDGNNKMVSAVDSGVTTGYRYNADGQRTVRTVGSVNTWYIYGMGGELVAEYPANGVTSTPQMEYGYRNGQMLIEGGCDVVRWLVADHLGTPRMSVDITGTPANMKRHDYLPFGEEIGAGIGVRTAAQGYSADCLRQKFTGYERDTETGLDFAQARYFSNVQGRFTSPDLPFADQVTHDPQSWNLYSYVRNNPINFIDPDGRSTHTNKDGVVVAVYDDDNLDVYKHDNLGKWNGKSTLASKGKGITNMGATEYINEFAAIDSNGSYLKNKDGSFVVAKNATIKFGDSFDGDISRLNADAQKMSLRNVANNSTNGLKFDIKVDKSIAPNGEYTGKLLNGKYASARSAGNYLAGLNGATSTQGGFYIDYVIYANMAGALQTGQWEGAATTFRRIMIEKKTYGPPPYYGEQEYSGRRIRAGLSHGVCVRNNRLGC